MLMQFLRVTKVPDKLEAGVCYVTNDGPNHTALMHFVNKDGTDIFTVGTYDQNAVTNHNLMATVDTIADRDNLKPLTNGLVLVSDATDDPNADVSPAVYFYNMKADAYTVLTNTMAESDTHIPMDPNPDW
jgi:hypothetical protein